MPHDWVLRILADLKIYAAENGMPSLEQHLNDTVAIAAMDIEGAALRASSRQRAAGEHAAGQGG